MTFFHEVGAPFGLNETQSEQLEQGFKKLEQEFNQAADVSDTAFAKAFTAQFEQLTLQNGIPADELETLVNHLYFTQEFCSLVTYVIPSYYNAGGDREVYSGTYELMMADMQAEG